MICGACRPHKSGLNLTLIGTVGYQRVEWWLKFRLRDVTNPRALAEILQKAEERLADMKHPDPYIRKFLGVAFNVPWLIREISTECPRWHEMVRFFCSISPSFYSS